MEAKAYRTTGTPRKGFIIPAILLSSALMLSSGPTASASTTYQADKPNAPESTYRVTNTDDSGPGSLRQAIINANNDGGRDMITFEIPGDGVHTIAPLSPLPDIEEEVHIDGFSQPGSSRNTNGTNLPSNAVLLIEISGANAGAGVIGLNFTGSTNLVEGLVINRFSSHGVRFAGFGSDTIEGSYIGTDPTGTIDLGNGGSGILVQTRGTALASTIGGNPARARNIVSGNAGQGIEIDTASSGHWILGNFVGVDATGAKALGNDLVGVLARRGTNMLIGGTSTGARNVISGNKVHGLEFMPGPNQSVTNSEILGNYIGTDLTGTKAVPNSGHGVVMNGSMGAVTGNKIGMSTSTSSGRNVISGNGAYGVVLHKSGASQNIVRSNHIGTNANGDAALGNGQHGIGIIESEGNTIGGLFNFETNLISGNGGDGVHIDGGEARRGTNSVLGNIIGVNWTVNARMPNAGSGVTIKTSDNNVVGGDFDLNRNWLAGNAANGVTVLSSNAARIQGNLIGATTFPGMGNTQNGIYLENSGGAMIGGDSDFTANKITANGLDAVVLVSGSGVELKRNSIFQNGGDGIDLASNGVTPNDAGDGDTGPNGLQNYPVFTFATFNNSNLLTMAGTLNSKPGTQYTLRFYYNPTCDASGHGEGQYFVDSVAVTTDGNGNASFSRTVDAPLAPVNSSGFVSATATDPLGNSSEFAGCFSLSGQMPTPTNTSTNTPVPTNTVAPSNTAVPSATHTSTQVPGQPTATRTSTQVPGQPTATHTATRTATHVPGQPTNTPSIPTHTATATATATSSTQLPTNTPVPSSTPTSCDMPFTDAHSGDWFYEYVQYLYCRDVISGYNSNPPCASGTPCFMPNNSTTRGQVSKMVTLTFGFPTNTTGGPHFSDVAPGSTFYPYIETLYNMRVLDGYQDGTFRPGNLLTRGQIAKIVVNAAIKAGVPGWQLNTPPTATFQDVAPGSTFFSYVETAAGKGILSGYPCGGNAGPCQDGGKPYFLPGNNTTRAQISKLLHLTVTQR